MSLLWRMLTVVTFVGCLFLPSNSLAEAVVENVDSTITIRMYWKTYSTTTAVTAYSSLETCNPNECVMASGKKPYDGAMACPRNVKFGTRILLDGKMYTCEDRTNIRFDGRYDVWMGFGKDSYKKARQFGIKKNQLVSAFEEKTN